MHVAPVVDGREDHMHVEGSGKHSDGSTEAGASNTAPKLAPAQTDRVWQKQAGCLYALP